MLDLDLPFLETDRLLLYNLNPAHLKALSAQMEDSALSKALRCPTLEMFDGIKERFLTFGLDGNRVSMHNWLLYRKDSGKLIGNFSYHIIFLRHKRGEIGYTLYDVADRQQGFMQELLPYALKFGFEELGLVRIEAFTAHDNWPSMSLLRKYGFKREGYARKHYRIGEENTDSFSFSLIKEDFIPEPDSIAPIEKLVSGFERQAIPEQGWTHEAHLKVALWYLLKEGEDEALLRMRSGIIAFNLGQGGENTASGGYHETLTVFWILVLAQFRNNHQGLAYEKVWAKLAVSPQAKADYPEQFYSKPVLQSVRDRARF